MNPDKTSDRAVVPLSAQVRTDSGARSLAQLHAVLHAGLYQCAFAAAVTPLALAAAVSAALGLDVSILTRDPSAIADIHPLAGALSNLGVLVWWASASVWLFTAALLCVHVDSREAFLFAVSSGLLSTYLALDDLFQLHERMFPGYFKVPERAVYAALGTAVLLYLFRFRSTIVKRRGVALLLSLLLLAASVLSDGVMDWWFARLGHWAFLVEDGFKWCGIVAWCTYCISWCRDALLTRTSTSNTHSVTGSLPGR